MEYRSLFCHLPFEVHVGLYKIHTALELILYTHYRAVKHGSRRTQHIFLHEPSELHASLILVVCWFAKEPYTGTGVRESSIVSGLPPATGNNCSESSDRFCVENDIGNVPSSETHLVKNINNNNKANNQAQRKASARPKQTLYRNWQRNKRRIRQKMYSNSSDWTTKLEE